MVVDLALDASDDDVVATLDPYVDDSAACIVIDQVTSATAKLMPVGRVAELGRQRGVAVIVDGAHAPALVDNPVVRRLLDRQPAQVALRPARHRHPVCRPWSPDGAVVPGRLLGRAARLPEIARLSGHD